MKRLFAFLLRCLCGLIKRAREHHILTKCNKALCTNKPETWLSKIEKLLRKWVKHYGSEEDCPICYVLNTTINELETRIQALKGEIENEE